MHYKRGRPFGSQPQLGVEAFEHRCNKQERKEGPPARKGHAVSPNHRSGKSAYDSNAAYKEVQWRFA
jgi:hypothetical protein